MEVNLAKKGYFISLNTRWTLLFHSTTKKLKLKAIVRYNSRVVIKWGIWYNLSDRVLFLKNIENI